jgi:3-deoxy-manno-octulosonate cytidylyltransferase (CMP-KDO synthetase)
MNFLGIIPSRYSSQRFPGKPLAMIAGKPMIQWVYENSAKALEEVYVATDDERIFKAVESFGGNVVMTSGEHRSGTDRCYEALNVIKSGTGINPDVVINIQGDEPFINPEQINLLKSCFVDPNTQIATLVKLIERQEDIFDGNKPKVIFNKDKFAIYFSRSVIPHIRNKEESSWIDVHNFYRHIGIYAYTSDCLVEISKLSPTSLELAESLEQLRWLENGYRIKIEVTSFDSPGVDTREDLLRIKNSMRL